MIWNDSKLTDWAMAGGIMPFDPACINPASVDLKWSGRVKLAAGMALDNFPIWLDMTDFVSDEGFYLLPGHLYLMDSLEQVEIPINGAGQLTLKSSMGRMGMDHLFSGFFDPGFIGTATWEISIPAPWPILVKPGQRVCQLTLSDMLAAPAKSYRKTGRYNYQSGPTEAR